MSTQNKTSARVVCGELVRNFLMATPEQIQESRKLLEAQWDSEGECGSCGWHALLYEHDVEDCDIAEALDGDGILRLGCRSKDDEDRWSHRGVKICIRPNTEISHGGTPAK